MKRIAILGLLLLVGGCVYYNGMYNARRFAGRARNAEKEGRTFDAASLWGQAGVKAESVLAQHPNSKWADEARLIQGTALVKLRNCPLGVRPLEQVVATSRDQRLTEQAAILLGDCRTSMGDPAGAMAAYGLLTNSPDPGRRRLALFAHGRAQRINGNYEGALTELAGTDYPGAQGERAAALAGLGRLPEVMVLVDSLTATQDSTAPWDSLLAAVSRHDPEAGSRLTDRLIESEALPRVLRARLLTAEGERWREMDPARSEARLAAAEKLGAGTPAGDEARLRAAQLRAQTVDSLAQFKELIERFEALGEGAGSVAPRAAQLAGFAHQVAFTADSVTPGSPNGELRLFLAGEMARDSLSADRFAARQFRRIVAEWPASPFAPKALLALIVLRPDQADSLRTTLLATYPTSPYVAMIQGGDSPEYLVLEDSLRRFAFSFRSDGQPTPVRPPQQQRPTTTAPREPVNR